MIKLRPYKTADASKAASWITSENDLLGWGVDTSLKYPVSEESFTEFSCGLMQQDSVYQMGILDDHDLIGHVLFSYPSDDHGAMLIGGLILDPARWEMGFGTGVISIILKYLFDILKVKKAYSYIPEQNEAMVKAFRSAGFVRTGDVDGALTGKDKAGLLSMEIYTDKSLGKGAENAVPEDKIIKDIINENRLSYAFQPIIDASNGEIFGYEALMRTDLGINVSPVTILDYAIRKKRLYDIEKLTLFNVMKEYEARKEEFCGRKVFLNSIPGFQLNEDDYDELKATYGANFENTIIEITENTEFKDRELSSLLERSSNDGFELAIDDYGTGYSNTSSLLSYLPKYIKIDRLLISNIHAETKKQHFVRNLISFAAANGVKTLAEGVETSAELKAVIELGIDYIQGFYTAKPEMEIIESIDEEVKKEIISDSVKGINFEERQIYTVGAEDELPLMKLALEKYTGILIDKKQFTLIGNTGYSAEMSVKIKDNTKCKLTIRDVFMESTQQLPCIEIGTGSELTLVLEGDNRMTKFGILVPENSKLKIEGEGNLQIRSQGVQSYAIGNLPSAGVGDIKWKGTGALDILVEADDGIGIGGGEFSGDNGIAISSGVVRIEPACGKAIAIGASKGKAKIRINDCKLQLDIKIEKGTGIGILEGIQDTVIKDSNVNILCSGNTISALGSVEDTGGTINIEDSELAVLANGQQMYLIGAKSGALDIGLINSAVNLRGEGSNVLALGTKDLDACIRARQVICNVKLASGMPVVYGAKPENTIFSGGLQSVSVNE